MVKCVVKKTACNDRTNALKSKAEQVNILKCKCTIRILEYERDEVEELYNIIEKIFMKRMEKV
jgi:hypothetical protein